MSIKEDWSKPATMPEIIYIANNTKYIRADIAEKAEKLKQQNKEMLEVLKEVHHFFAFCEQVTDRDGSKAELLIEKLQSIIKKAEIQP